MFQPFDGLSDGLGLRLVQSTAQVLQSLHHPLHRLILGALNIEIHVGQRWEVVEYKYLVTVLKYIPLLIFLITFYFYFLHLEHKYLYFLLLTFPKQAGSFSLNVCLVA